MEYLINSDETELKVSFEAGRFVVNGEEVEPKIEAVGNGRFSIIFNNKSCLADVVSYDALSKNYVIRIGAEEYSIQLKDQYHQLLDKLGFSSADPTKVANIKAPMPGLVLEIMIEIGQSVEADDSLLLLEAMKMENVLKSPGAGVIKSIQIKAGDTVDKNQVLIEFE